MVSILGWVMPSCFREPTSYSPVTITPLCIHGVVGGGLWLVPCSLHVPHSLVNVLVEWLVVVSSDYYGRFCHVYCPSKYWGRGGVKPLKDGICGVLILVQFNMTGPSIYNCVLVIACDSSGADLILAHSCFLIPFGCWYLLTCLVVLRCYSSIGLYYLLT